jgi:bifunctional DNA-binding transcriptional regulator/antitoxin component of YhaV-PrlF toxin-antitoxin module
VVKLTITVKIDKFGKIFLPKALRKKISAIEFEVHVKKDRLELIPLKHPLELFGTLKSIDTKKLKLDELHGDDHEFDA